MRTDPVRLALTVAGFLAVGGTPTAAMLIFLIVVAVLLAISMWRSVRLATILALLAGAILMRVALMDRTGSDVLTVMAAAIDRMLEGGNPYGTGYAESRPPGASYPYGPLALLWYLPLRSRPDIIELGAAIAVALILALRGRLVGLAVYAASTALVAAAVDGSNDTSLGLLLLGAFMAAERWPALGAAMLAGAVAFKLSALAFVPAFLLRGGWRVAASFLAVSLMAWAPVIAPWGIPSFIRSAEGADATHRAIIWSLGAIVRDLTGVTIRALDELRFFLGAAVLVATLALRRSRDAVILGGAAVYVVTLHAGNWGTFAYFAGLAPLVCWRLDDWLGLSSRPLLPRRVALPATPVREAEGDPPAQPLADADPWVGPRV